MYGQEGRWGAKESYERKYKIGEITMKSSDQLWFSDILEIFLDFFFKFRIKKCVKPNLYRTKKNLDSFHKEYYLFDGL